MDISEVKLVLATGFQDIDWVFPDLKDLWFFVTAIGLQTELVFQDTVFLELLFMMRRIKLFGYDTGDLSFDIGPGHWILKTL